MAAFSSVHNSGDHYDLNCTVCLETFKDPKVLPCLHTFCTACLGRILSSGTNTSPGTIGEQVSTISLTCPQCRAEHAIPEGGVESFQTDFSIADLVRNAEVEKQGGECASILCEECDSSEPAVAHCTKCCSYLCEYCSGAHKKMKQFRDHDVVSLQDFDHEKFQPKPHPHYCPQHPSEVLKLYCKSCNVLVCCDCIVNAHQGHTFGSINKDTRSEVEQLLEDMSCSAKKTLDEFSGNLKYVTEVEKVTTDTATKLKAEINAVFDRHVAAIESHRTSLLEEGENKYNTSVKEVWAQKEYIEQKSEALSTTLRFTECLRQCKSDSEMLCLAAQAIPQLKKLETVRWDPTTVSEVENKYISLKGYNYLGTCNMEKLEEGYDPIVITFSDNPLSDDLPNSVPLGVKKQINLVVMRKLSKRPAVLREEPIVNIKFLWKTLPARITQHQTAAGYWSVTFTPICGGLHTVSAHVEGTKSFKWQFTVPGKPKIGSLVSWGPHWTYTDIVGQLGTVVDNNSQDEPGYPLVVVWDPDGDYYHRWGPNKYEVQLLV